jgi:hypothetical protein
MSVICLHSWQWDRQCGSTQTDTSVTPHSAKTGSLNFIGSRPTSGCGADKKKIQKGKVKLSLCFNWAPRHEGVLGEWRYSSTHSLTSALDGGEWSASRSGRFTPRERAPDTHWIGVWVGPRAVRDAVVKRKIPSPRRKSNPRTPIVQPVAQRYTDWAVTALRRYWEKKLKVNPSVCLIKHDATRRMGKSWCIASRNSYLGTRWR